MHRVADLPAGGRACCPLLLLSSAFMPPEGCRGQPEPESEGKQLELGAFLQLLQYVAEGIMVHPAPLDELKS